MYSHRKRKRVVRHREHSFFRPQNHQKEYQRLEQAYNYLTRSTAYDKQRKHMRGVQLAQQLVDPDISNIQAVLNALQNKMYVLKRGSIMEMSTLVSSEESCHRYPCEHESTGDYQAWMHFVNCLLRFAQEESIIETDVYNYAEGNRSEVPDDDASDAGEITIRALPIRTNDNLPARTENDESEASTRPGFLRRLFGGRNQNDTSE